MVLQAKEQPEDSRAYGSLENTTLFGVAAQVRALVALATATREGVLSPGSLEKVTLFGVAAQGGLRQCAWSLGLPCRSLAYAHLGVRE